MPSFGRFTKNLLTAVLPVPSANTMNIRFEFAVTNLSFTEMLSASDKSLSPSPIPAYNTVLRAYATSVGCPVCLSNSSDSTCPVMLTRTQSNDVESAIVRFVSAIASVPSAETAVFATLRSPAFAPAVVPIAAIIRSAQSKAIFLNFLISFPPKKNFLRIFHIRKKV